MLDKRTVFGRAWNWFWSRFRAFIDTYERWRFAGNTRWRSIVAAWKAMFTS